ncbi:MAG TPA: ATP-binding cassette domain-containing protein [Acidimicrobiia bacterium]|nr:ATP-binding cassette domain-containing protein [Acidimicrobiia bacterium]
MRAEGLGKRFGDLWALRDLDLEVPRGSVLGLLGHNGAGKTTALRILTTISSPSEGRASVAGFDVVAESAAVRSRIGVANQEATVDGLLSARLNLEMIGRLHHLSKRESRQRADELLELLNLSGEATKLVKTFSGGMRRRLDLAASLVARPQVLFLDEPTTGLDPIGRGDLWHLLRELVRDGTTLILTTQYLEEADRLADDIVVLDRGRAVAHGTPDELKARIGNDRVDVKVSASSELVAAAGALARFAANDPTFDEDVLIVTAPINEGTRIIDVVRALDDAGIDAVDLNRRQASLDDVFLTLTGSGRSRTPAEVPA